MKPKEQRERRELAKTIVSLVDMYLKRSADSVCLRLSKHAADGELARTSPAANADVLAALATMNDFEEHLYQVLRSELGYRDDQWSELWLETRDDKDAGFGPRRLKRSNAR